jgi:hypothetical protein
MRRGASLQSSRVGGAMPDLPGIAFEGKSYLYAEMKSLVTWSAAVISRELSVFALAQQKLAAGLDHRDAVIGDDVGGGVGLAP